MVQRMLRLREVLRLRGKSKSMHYKDIEEGRFPAGITIGPRTVVWPESDIEAEQQALLATRDNADAEAARKQRRDICSKAARTQHQRQAAA